MYGALTKEMHSAGISSPRTEAPYPDMSYKSLVRKIQSFTSPRWYSRGPYSSYGPNYGHSCQDSSFANLLGVADDVIEGLDLHDLVPR